MTENDIYSIIIMIFCDHMPIIKPISDLRNNFHTLSEICHAEDQPVFITKNGKGDLVVMSISHYERQQALLELYMKLGEAEHQSRCADAKNSGYYVNNHRQGRRN